MSGDGKLRAESVWAYAVGGMVGGGIFSVLGVVVALAGAWAWASFLFAGLIALATAYSYVAMAEYQCEGGGAFAFLRRAGHTRAAPSLAWVLILGYVLTMSVYAFTFGNYLGAVLGFEGLLARVVGDAVIVGLVGLNLIGVQESASFESIAVWFKIAVLVALGVTGLFRFDPSALSQGVTPESGTVVGILVGGASVFMAYEGFQLLTYDLEAIRDWERKLRPALLLSVVTVIATYVLVALGAASLVGAETLVQEKEIAIAAAGTAGWGSAGLYIVSAAAAFSTGSAINATLFATARLARTVAEAGDLPAAAAKVNSKGIPAAGLVVLGALAILLATIGSLSGLVEAASLVFLFTFSAVNFVASRRGVGRRWISLAGLAGSVGAGGLLLWRLAVTRPVDLGVVLAVTALAVFARPWILRHVRTLEPDSDATDHATNESTPA